MEKLKKSEDDGKDRNQMKMTKSTDRNKKNRLRGIDKN